jgi:excisionase family DNA binding protein
MPALPGYFTTREASEVLGITQAAVKDAVRRGVLAAIMVAQRRLIPAAEVERYRRESLGCPGRKPRTQQPARPAEERTR